MVLFGSKTPRAHPVVELHACLYAIMESRNDRNIILWHAKTGECCLEEDSVYEVVRFGKVDRAYTSLYSFLPSQLEETLSTIYEHNTGGRTVRLETTLFFWQDPKALTVFTEAASDGFQKYLAGARYQRHIFVVAALIPILLLLD